MPTALLQQLGAKLLPQHRARKIARSIHEKSPDAARSVCTTPVYDQSRKDRKKVEMLFTHRKQHPET